MKHPPDNESAAPRLDDPVTIADFAAAWHALPVPATPDLWPRLESRLGSRRRSAGQPLFWAGAASAVLLVTLLVRTGDPPAPPPASAAVEVEALTRLSGLLETEWRQKRHRRGIVSGAEIRRIDDLAALIGVVDEQLMPPPADSERARDLWRQRVVLMNELLADEMAPAVMIQPVRSDTL